MMKHKNRLYSVTTVLLIFLGLMALGWFVFYQEFYPSMFGILTIGAALSLLLHSRNQGAERYGTRHILRTDLLLLGGNLAAAAGLYGLINCGVLASSYNCLTGFVLVTAGLAAYFNYGAPVPKRFFQRVHCIVNAAIFE